MSRFVACDTAPNGTARHVNLDHVLEIEAGPFYTYDESEEAIRDGWQVRLWIRDYDTCALVRRFLLHKPEHAPDRTGYSDAEGSAKSLARSLAEAANASVVRVDAP